MDRHGGGERERGRKEGRLWRKKQKKERLRKSDGADRGGRKLEMELSWF